MVRDLARVGMDSRERLLTAINNGKPDRLPVQVHRWMPYYLRTYLGGIDQWAAYEQFGMDMVIYSDPVVSVDDTEQSRWIRERVLCETDREGVRHWKIRVRTPGGDLTGAEAGNDITTWTTEYLIKTERDFELFEKYCPSPTFDWSPVMRDLNRLGNRGIVRTASRGYGQGAPWQDLCTLMGTVSAIMTALDEPERTRHMLDVILAKRISTIEKSPPNPSDIVSTGGGAGSDTVISPDLHARFCLPYDRVYHVALREKSPRTKIVYHLCGGVMNLLDLVATNGADGLETMTPPSMGGNADLAAARRMIGDRLFFVGGFDQQQGFERGTPEDARRLVVQCHAACPDGGYICCPSDHFFHGNPENIRAFADAARECRYDG